MRDAHRIKERVDFSLEGRQVFRFLFTGLIALVVTFGLGVVVGRRMVEHPSMGPRENPLASVDKKAAALDQVRHDPPLTFQDELTRKLPEPPAPKPAILPQIRVPTISEADISTREVDSSAFPSQLQEKGAEPLRHASAVSFSDKVDSGAITARTTSSSPAGAGAKAAAGEPGGLGAFTLQLSASTNREDADRQAARLRDRGYAPYIVKAQVSGKGTYYRVRMGSFINRDAAQRFLEDFRRETQLDAYVASTQ